MVKNARAFTHVGTHIRPSSLNPRGPSLSSCILVVTQWLLSFRVKLIRSILNCIQEQPAASIYSGFQFARLIDSLKTDAVICKKETFI